MNNTTTTTTKEPIKVEYFAPTKIIVGYSRVEGVGVFATQDIKEGEIIERCPMVALAHRSNYQHDPQIYKYLYRQPICPCNECKRHGGVFNMVLGYGMLYNHQDIPNTDWKFDYVNKIADVVAVKNIAKNSEIFVSYGSSYFQNREKVTAEF
jgi:SET domain-containing protein